MRRHDAIWYGDKSPPWYWRLGGIVFDAIAAIRRRLYARGWLRTQGLSCPVIVVGNLTLGGTGKTPLVMWLAECLQMDGYRPGIVSRGYGGGHRGAPLLVTAETDPDRVGDEAVLLARHAGLPVAVCRNRPAAGRFLIERTGVNVVISDDGLQHYALGRDMEICVIDGERRFGNGRLFPAGPLREPIERLGSVDYVVSNGLALEGEFAMELVMQEAWSLTDNRHRALDEFQSKPVHAVAGIGNPRRFFAQLQDHGLKVIEHPYPDHHRFEPRDLDFGDDYPILMTEKDAVKCRSLQARNTWAVPVVAELPDALATTLLVRLAEIQSARTDSSAT